MLYVPFFALKKCLKNLNKGTINVLQGGGGSAEYGQRPYFYIFFLLDPSLSEGSQKIKNVKIWSLTILR